MRRRREITTSNNSAAHTGEKQYNSPPGIAVFAFVDIASFLVFFIIFTVERLKATDLFANSAAQLSVSLGLVNTLILVTSGFCVAMAEASSRTKTGAMITGRADQQSQRWLLAGIAVGSLFLFTKIVEYGTKIAGGITPATNVFFTYYFVLTGLHLIHYLAGMVFLCLLATRRWRAKEDYEIWARSGALYWHMVDIIWVVMFPLLYLRTGN